jgi:hypothetical protein
MINAAPMRKTGVGYSSMKKEKRIVNKGMKLRNTAVSAASFLDNA